MKLFINMRTTQQQKAEAQTGGSGCSRAHAKAKFSREELSALKLEERCQGEAGRG